MGECVELGLLQLMIYSPLSCLWHVGPWVSGGQLILHSLLLFRHLANSLIYLLDCPVTFCFCKIDPSLWDLAVGHYPFSKPWQPDPLASGDQCNTPPIALTDSRWLGLTHGQITFSDEKQHVFFGPSPSISLQGLDKVLHWWSKIRAYIVMNLGCCTRTRVGFQSEPV